MLSLLMIFLVLSVTPACLGQNVKSWNYLPYNFTLAAIKITRPNANLTGTPLVLGQAGAIDGESFYVTSTYASYPYNDYPSLSLVNKTLRAYTKTGQWITNTTTTQSGGTLSWGTTAYQPYTQPDPPIFSAIQFPYTSYPVLAVYGFANLWSLCPFSGRLPQTNLVFNVSADTTSPPPPYLGFNPTDCYPVWVNMVPVA